MRKGNEASLPGRSASNPQLYPGSGNNFFFKF